MTNKEMSAFAFIAEASLIAKTRNDFYSVIDRLEGENPSEDYKEAISVLIKVFNRNCKYSKKTRILKYIEEIIELNKSDNSADLDVAGALEWCISNYKSAEERRNRKNS